MMNLREDIAEMFASFDGYDRYEEWIEISSRRMHHDQQERDRRRSRLRDRDYHRAYQLSRYRSDPGFRERHKEAVMRYRDRVLGSDRPRRTFGPIAIKHGSYRGYQQLGCRCTACRAASAAYQRQRRAKLAQTTIAEVA